MARTFKYRDRLIELIWRVPEADGYHAYGDPQRRLVHAVPRGPPDLVEGIPVGTPYSEQLLLFLAHNLNYAPKHTGAFVLGCPVPSIERHDQYSVPIQWYGVSEEDRTQAADLDLQDWCFEGFSED